MNLINVIIEIYYRENEDEIDRLLFGSGMEQFLLKGRKKVFGRTFLYIGLNAKFYNTKDGS